MVSEDMTGSRYGPNDLRQAVRILQAGESGSSELACFVSTLRRLTRFLDSVATELSSCRIKRGVFFDREVLHEIMMALVNISKDFQAALDPAYAAAAKTSVEREARRRAAVEPLLQTTRLQFLRAALSTLHSAMFDSDYVGEKRLPLIQPLLVPFSDLIECLIAAPWMGEGSRGALVPGMPASVIPDPLVVDLVFDGLAVDPSLPQLVKNVSRTAVALAKEEGISIADMDAFYFAATGWSMPRGSSVANDFYTLSDSMRIAEDATATVQNLEDSQLWRARVQKRMNETIDRARRASLRASLLNASKPSPNRNATRDHHIQRSATDSKSGDADSDDDDDDLGNIGREELEEWDDGKHTPALSSPQAKRPALSLHDLGGGGETSIPSANNPLSTLPSAMDGGPRTPRAPPLVALPANFRASVVLGTGRNSIARRRLSTAGELSVADADALGLMPLSGTYGDHASEPITERRSLDGDQDSLLEYENEEEDADPIVLCSEISELAISILLEFVDLCTFALRYQMKRRIKLPKAVAKYAPELESAAAFSRHEKMESIKTVASMLLSGRESITTGFLSNIAECIRRLLSIAVSAKQLWNIQTFQEYERSRRRRLLVGSRTARAAASMHRSHSFVSGVASGLRRTFSLIGLGTDRNSAPQPVNQTDSEPTSPADIGHLYYTDSYSSPLSKEPPVLSASAMSLCDDFVESDAREMILTGAAAEYRDPIFAARLHTNLRLYVLLLEENVYLRKLAQAINAPVLRPFLFHQDVISGRCFHQDEPIFFLVTGLLRSLQQLFGANAQERTG